MSTVATGTRPSFFQLPRPLNATTPLRALLVSLAYFAGGHIDRLLGWQSSPAVLWPPNGVLLSVLLFSPTRTWWIYALAVLPADRLISRQAIPLGPGLGLYVSNLGQSLLAASCFRALTRRRALDHVSLVLYLLLTVGLLAPLLGAFSGAASICWARPHLSYATTIRGWFVSNALTNALIFPALLAIANPARGGATLRVRRQGWRLKLEPTLVFASLVLAMLWVFESRYASGQETSAWLFAPWALLIWIALRFGSAAYFAAQLLVAVVAIHGTVHGKGPFNTAGAESILHLQLFLLLTCVSLTLLAAVICDHEHANLCLSASEIQLRVTLEELHQVKNQLQAENQMLREDIALRTDQEMVGRSPAFQKVLREIERVAAGNSTVLIQGQTGAGKELVARAIHRQSARKDQTMVRVNCAALPGTLIEAELFGREKGAYTGALTQQLGRFETADRSTLFLDEVGELPLELQPKLLRALEEGEFERLGSSKVHHCDVRVIAATNRNLERAVREGRFRQDLFYRLNVFPIHVPALRDRREDIPLLVWTFVGALGKTLGRKIELIPKSTMDALVQYDWPGNVRELRNLIERAMIVSDGSTLKVELPCTNEAVNPLASVDAMQPQLTLYDVERRHILAVLERCKWRVSGAGGAAQTLGLKPTTLEHKMRKLQIERPTKH
jgi:DNA-binding NtrC family response regulator